jgi:hypothetical protein
VSVSNPAWFPSFQSSAYLPGASTWSWGATGVILKAGGVLQLESLARLLLHSPAVQPWANLLTSLSLGFLSVKQE